MRKTLKNHSKNFSKILKNHSKNFSKILPYEKNLKKPL